MLLSYRKFKATPFQGNLARSLVLRQHYAKVLLPQLVEGKRIINIDETWLPTLDFRRYRWCKRGVKNTLPVKDLQPKVNMIVAIDTLGNVYTSLTQVNTDSEVMTSYLTRLSTVLTQENRDWRRNSVILLDGAAYHKS